MRTEPGFKLLAPWLLLFLLFGTRVAAAGPGKRLVTIGQAIESTRHNNITWKSLKENLVQGRALKELSIGLLLPKLSAEVQWVHMGERHVPDFSQFADIGEVMGTLVQTVVEKHPDTADRFLPYMDMMKEQTSGSSMADFVPVRDTIAGTFSLMIPVINPEAIFNLKGSYEMYDSILQRVAYGRDKLLYNVAKAYMGLVSLQSMVRVAQRSLDRAREHYESSKVRANLQTATKLEVKRAELEVTSAQSRKAEITAALARAKSGFRYLTGIRGGFEVKEPGIESMKSYASETSLDQWLERAKKKRKDLAAAEIEVKVAQQNLNKVWTKYFPSLNLFGQAKLDNNEHQRFDDDPFSWTIGATLSMNLWDGGIREAQLKTAKSKLKQAELAARDVENKIVSDVESAYKALVDAKAALELAERQAEVARDTQALARASEMAGAATHLEVLDANTMAYASDAQELKARLDLATAVLDLLLSCGEPLPFSK
ncbi:MAG: TolC family protein [Deltaproteobacteria bacterium]|nr:TolC family protein [Deltaproteobacteria bacterium]